MSTDVPVRIPRQLEEPLFVSIPFFHDPKDIPVPDLLLEGILLSDDNIEEIVVNCSTEPLWIYHRRFGWLKTNIIIPTEPQIHNYASIIARRVGRQITTLEPLLDAHLVTGDRANATLFPISSKGNSMTIRRFARKPWTISNFLKTRTLNSEAAALIWLVMQYEMNMIVSGGTGSGKTSFLTVCMPFIQPNQRIVSIEDTRELQLPRFLHWVPMTTRQPNPEGKGEITMLDLMINSLRMRPDRIILGETRRQKEAEVLFEAMLTGHSVYSTVHADTASQTIKRLANPPINVPESMLEAVHLNVVMFRDRRKSIRRCFQIAEFLPTSETEGTGMKANLLYRWRPNTDTITAHSKSVSLFDKLSMHTGLTELEITEQLVTKKKVLDWTLKNNIFELDEIGQIMALYYSDPDGVLEVVEKNQSSRKLLGVEVN